MKPLVVAIAISLITAGSALAAPKRMSPADRAKVSGSKAMVVDSESYDVYVGGRLIGRDPDPAIRARLRADHHLLSGY